MSATMARPREHLVTAELAAQFLLDYHGVVVAPATIRQWASRGHIATDRGRGRSRYSVREVEKHARARGLIA